MKTTLRYRLLLFILFLLIVPKYVCAEDKTLLDKEISLAKSAGVDDESMDRILSAANRHQLNNENKIRWIKQIRTATGEGLPASVMLNKIEEGVAKNIDSKRIDAALTKTLRQLRFVNKLSEGEPHNHETSAPPERNLINARMSELLSAGLTETEMNRLYTSWKSATPKQKLEAMTFYTVAKQAGLKPEDAGHIASSGIEHNHFHSFPLELSMMIKAAKANHIKNSDITSEALKVINGKQTVQQAHRNMGIRQLHPNPSRVYNDYQNNNMQQMGMRNNDSRFGSSGSGSFGSGSFGGGRSGGGGGGRGR